MLSEIIKNKMIARFKFYDVNSTGTLDASDYETMVQRMTSARNLEPGSEEYRRLHDTMMNESGRSFRDTPTLAPTRR